MNIHITPLNLVEFKELGEEINSPANTHVHPAPAKDFASGGDLRTYAFMYADDVDPDTVAGLQAKSDEICNDDEWGAFTDGLEA